MKKLFIAAITKRLQSDYKAFIKWLQSDYKAITKWLQSCYKVITKWCSNKEMLNPTGNKMTCKEVNFSISPFLWNHVPIWHNNFNLSRQLYLFYINFRKDLVIWFSFDTNTNEGLIVQSNIRFVSEAYPGL